MGDICPVCIWGKPRAQNQFVRGAADIDRMRFRIRLLNSSLAVLTALAAVATTAGAATQIGQKCSVTSSGPPVMFQTAVTAGESYTVPASGILTSWGVNASTWGSTSMLAATLGGPAGAQWTVIRTTPFQLTTANAVNEFPARMPVSAGQILGISAYNSNALMCGTSDPADTITNAGTFTPAGGSFSPSTVNTFRVGVWAVVEPDVDGDGFGDDSQDKCPQSAAFQNACPVLAISQQLSATSKQISILATASVDTQLTAVAVVSIPRIGKAKARRVTIQGTAQPFSAGVLRRIKLSLPSSVRATLKQKSLGAAVTISGVGIANNATVTGKVTLKKLKR